MKKSTDSEKIMSQEEQDQLIKVTKKMAEEDLLKGRSLWVKRWMMVDLALHTGLTVAEIANLRVGDVRFHEKSIFVRKGKCNNPGDVAIDNELAEHLASFIEWKKMIEESVDHEAHLLVHTHLKTVKEYTPKGVQALLRETVKHAGLPEHYSSRSCRHTFAANLFEVTKSLIVLQKQLRHSSIAVTTKYVKTILRKAIKATETKNEEIEICPLCHQIIAR
jgi:site-specific recombinase XerD